MDFKTAEKVAKRLSQDYSGPLDVAIVCGSGLGHLSKSLRDPVVVRYEDIEHWPMTTVSGHKAELVFGTLGGKGVVCMRGRFHSYEGYDIRKTSFPMLVFKALGVKLLIVTNAAGGLRGDFNVGDMMVIADHINVPGLAGKHPLVGPNDEKLGPRFPSMSDCYDKKLRELAFEAGKEVDILSRMHMGTYSFVSGPAYETSAESRYLRLIGADAVGMSTVPETIVAHYCGIKVLGISMITNKVIMDEDNTKVANHEEVLAATKGDNEVKMQALISRIVSNFDSKVKTATTTSQLPKMRGGIDREMKTLNSKVDSLKSTLTMLTVLGVASLAMATAALLGYGKRR